MKREILRKIQKQEGEVYDEKQILSKSCKPDYHQWCDL